LGRRAYTEEEKAEKLARKKEANLVAKEAKKAAKIKAKEDEKLRRKAERKKNFKSKEDKEIEARWEETMLEFGVNKICSTCIKLCKQHNRIIIIQCPLYVKQGK
jgi:hypothetical protein